jgi:hypothetical protein
MTYVPRPHGIGSARLSPSHLAGLRRLLWTVTPTEAARLLRSSKTTIEAASCPLGLLPAATVARLEAAIDAIAPPTENASRGLEDDSGRTIGAGAWSPRVTNGDATAVKPGAANGVHAEASR